MAGATVVDQLDDNNKFIRKHGTQFMAIGDENADIPEDFFEEVTANGFVRTLPSVLPSGYRNMGYITTDGIAEGRDVGSNDVTMVQDIEPARSDIDSLTRTLAVNFGESNSWTKALAHGLPVAEWPTVKSSRYTFHDGERSDFPYYRILIFTQDGVGDNAVFRVEFAYRAKVTDIAGRTLNRTDVEATGRTFTCYKDDAVGRSYTEDSAPALRAALPAI